MKLLPKYMGLIGIAWTVLSQEQSVKICAIR